MVKVLAAVLMGFLLGVTALLVLDRFGQHEVVYSGRAYVGAERATVRLTSQEYAAVLPGTTWIGRNGQLYDTSAMPSCLRRVGTTAQVKVGVVQGDLPGGGSMPVVVWVSCE